MAQALKGKIAVITGGASGMGEASVDRFVAEGAFVFVADRSGREEEVAARHGDRAEAVKADVTAIADIQALFGRVEQRFGKLDILFNNAGYGGASTDLKPIHENTDSNIHDMIAINLHSVLLAIKYGVPLMLKAGGGSIINTASTAALTAHPNMAAYAAAKGGVTALTPSIARELGALGIRINTICPGPIETPLLSYYMNLNEGMRQAFMDVTALKRLGRPDEIASAALFLASDQSSYVTGAVLPVDGGQSC